VFSAPGASHESVANVFATFSPPDVVTLAVAHEASPDSCCRSCDGGGETKRGDYDFHFRFLSLVKSPFMALPVAGRDGPPEEGSIVALANKARTAFGAILGPPASWEVTVIFVKVPSGGMAASWVFRAMPCHVGTMFPIAGAKVHAGACWRGTEAKRDNQLFHVVPSVRNPSLGFALPLVSGKPKLTPPRS
jgi:hypothetical protein